MGSKRWRSERLTGAYAETCSVARTDDLVALDRATREDSSVMGADILDSVVATPQVEDCNLSSVYVNHPMSAGRELRLRTDPDPVTHGPRKTPFVACDRYGPVLCT